MNRRDFLFLPLTLVGCASLPREATSARVVPKFGQFTSTPKSGRLAIDVEFHDPDQVRDVCRKLNQRFYPGGAAPPGAPACVSDLYHPGHDTLHVAQPKDWDDLEVVIEIGHEVLHALGGNHA